MSASFRSRSVQAVDAGIGTACLVGGFALAVVVVAVRLDSLRDLPTGLIRRNPVLMLGLAVAFILGGSRLLWQSRQVRTAWSPTRPGQRFQSLKLYTREGCLLCDEAAHLLGSYRSWLPEPQIVDVSSDPKLQSQYGGCVPVVEIDGRRRFTGQVNEVLLRRLIEGTPPDPV